MKTKHLANLGERGAQLNMGLVVTPLF